ncbi:kinase-like domain-containing protein [Geopyxis carbonaria]|nr:kinase-like domain-containing protein [Geopyxis carbonaria]
MMNLDEAEGSPVAKRRSSHFGFSSADTILLASAERGSPRSSKITPKRNNSVKKSSGHVFQKPNLIRSRQQPIPPLDFMGTTDTASRLRRISSVENITTRDSPFNTRSGPLPNASIHPQISSSNQPHPLSHHLPQSHYQPQHHTSAGPSTDWETPVNYKAARPNPAAFHSTGFVSKRGRMLNNEKEHGPQPDTPCKRSNLFSASTFQPKVTGSRIRMREFGTPQTPISDLGSFGTGFFGRRDSVLSNDGDELADFYERRSQSSNGDVELPPTPTKPTGSKNTSNSFGDDIFKISKRPRIEGNGCLGNVLMDILESKTRLLGRFSPHTPKNEIIPPDPSSLSISGKPNDFMSKRRSLPAEFPVTPAKDIFPFGLDTSGFPSNTVPSFNGNNHQVTSEFKSRFIDIKHVGSGEFSEVYQVTEKRRSMNSTSVFTNSSQLVTPGNSSVVAFSSSPSPYDPPLQFYAVKKAKSRFLGPRDRNEKLSEARILKELKRHDHIVEYIDEWVEDEILYIQTEFCENGSLDKFLEMHGNKGRLDEFRVWKITLELCMGLRHIHDSGYMHLDLKPANVLIASDGSLKISDFGMALKFPAPSDLEREGDREYIAPEVLTAHNYDKPVDVFALGLTIIETAGNEALPPNGPHWQSLREGDLSVAPILSTSLSGEFVHRDDNGNPIGTELLHRLPQSLDIVQGTRNGYMLHKPRGGDLIHAPQFMVDGALESLVRKMISKDPAERPTAGRLLGGEELRWVDERRRSPATIFEGLWGPDDASPRFCDQRQNAPRISWLLEFPYVFVFGLYRLFLI